MRREHFGQLAPGAPGKHRLLRTQVPPPLGGPGLRGRSPRHATPRRTPATVRPLPGLGFEARRPVLASGLPSVRGPSRAPSRPRPGPTPPPPRPGLPSLPWRRPRPATLLRRPTVRDLAAPGAQPAEGHRERTRPAPSAGRGAQQGGATQTGAAGLELCPSPRQSAQTGLAPGSRPRLPPRGLAARGRGLLAQGRDKRATTPKGEGADGQETTFPGRSRAGAVKAAGRVGLLRSSPMCGAAREPTSLQN